MLTVTNITKHFTPGAPVLEGVSFAVGDGEIACLLGPSGCGKTTLLRVIAGLEIPDSGQVHFDGQDVTQVQAHRRGFGLMFQDYALFPHMSVGQNVAFGLRMAGMDKAVAAQRVEAMLDLVELPGYAGRPVDALSGGEQQRVALARTLAPAPRLVLLDEPLANLDRLLRETLVDDLRTILKRIGVASIFVTHDQQEAFALADRVAVMRAGRIEQEGAPAEVYARPANAFVAGFLGFHNLVPVLAVREGGRSVSTPLGEFPLAPPAEGMAWRSELRLLIRPEAAEVVAAQPGDRPAIVGQVTRASFRGSICRVSVTPAAAPATTLSFDLATQQGGALPGPGENVVLALDPQGLMLVEGTGNGI